MSQPARHVFGTLLVVVVLGVTLGSDAWAAVLCKSRNGTLALRESCARSQVVVDVAALQLQGPKGDAGMPGPQGAQGPAGPQGPSGSPGSVGGGPTVRDANGAFVGFAVPGGALRNVDDFAVVLPVGTTGFLEGDRPLGYPMMADCAGQPYLFADFGSSYSGWDSTLAPIVRSAFILGNQALFQAGPWTNSGSIQSVRPANSSIVAIICGNGCAGESDCCNCASPTGAFGPVAPAEALDLDTLGLVPPFRIDSPL
jgi:hypothetical protein